MYGDMRLPHVVSASDRPRTTVHKPPSTAAAEHGTIGPGGDRRHSGPGESIAVLTLACMLVCGEGSRAKGERVVCLLTLPWVYQSQAALGRGGSDERALVMAATPRV